MTRVTFYRHFPDHVALFRACTSHGLERWPPPDATAWRAVRDPGERLRIALTELYAYYAVAGPGLVVIARDAPHLAPDVLALPSRAHHLRAAAAVLTRGWEVRGGRREAVVAAVDLAVSVTTWDVLVREHGLADAAAIDVLAGLVETAAGRR